MVWNPRQAENPFCFHLLPPYRPALHLGLQESEMTWRLTRRHHHSRGRPLSHLCDFGPAAPFHGRPFLILSPGESLVIFYVSAQDYLLRYSVMAVWEKYLKKSAGCAKSLQSGRFFATLWTVAHQAPLSMGLSNQEYWRGLPCPPPGDLPDSGIEPASLMSLTLAGGFFTISTTWEVDECITYSLCCTLETNTL